MIKAVGFDLDGTLLDHRAAAGAAIEAWVSDHLPGTSSSVAAAWLGLEDTYFAEYLAGRLGFQDQRRSRMRDFLALQGLTPGEWDLDGSFAVYLEHYQAAWTADPHAELVLAELQATGLTLAVLTNGQRDQQRNKLERLGLLGYFDVVLTLDDVPAGKPSALAFGALSDALGVVPDAIAYVGDDPHADGLGAHEAGMFSIWLDRGLGASSPAGPAVVTSLQQVMDVLQERVRVP